MELLVMIFPNASQTQKHKSFVELSLGYYSDIY